MASARAPKNGCSCAARWEQDDVKKIWLNNLNRLSRHFFFVERAEGYRRQMQSGPRFDEHLARSGRVLFWINFFSHDLFLPCLKISWTRVGKSKNSKYFFQFNSYIVYPS